MSYKDISLMDAGYFFCPYVPLSETPVVFQDLSGQDRTDRYEEYNRLVEQANEVHRRTLQQHHHVIIKDSAENVNWRQDGF